MSNQSPANIQSGRPREVSDWLMLTAQWLLDILTTIPVYIASTNPPTHTHTQIIITIIIIISSDAPGGTVENTVDMESADLCSRPRSASWQIPSLGTNHFTSTDLNFLL